MKVAVATHFYPPEPGAGALRVRSMVDAFAAAGHDVTVVTAYPSFPRGEFSERRRPMVRVERNGRTRIVRLNSLLVPRMPGSRLLHWLSTAAAQSLYLLTARERFDVVVISSPPITLALPGLIGAMRHRAKLVVDVRDVFPDLGVQIGVWKRDGLVVRTLDKMVRRLYRRADLVSSSPRTAKSRSPPAASTRPASCSRATPTSAIRWWATTCARANGFTAVYAGNLGLTTDVDVLADAANLVAKDDITIEIIGDGAQRTHLGERVAQRRHRQPAHQGKLSASGGAGDGGQRRRVDHPAAQGLESEHPDEALRLALGGLPRRGRRGGRSDSGRNVARRDVHAGRRRAKRSPTSCAGSR